MKIVLATALYPPDIAEPASYVKTLAKHLTASHTVTIVTYGHIPEKIPGVRIIATAKSYVLPVRLLLYTISLFRAGREADLLYMQNGASVELPVAIVSIFTRIPVFIRFGDTSAHVWAQKHFLRRLVENFVSKKGYSVTAPNPLARPEILPFDEYPAKEFQNYENSWKEHLVALENTFAHA